MLQEAHVLAEQTKPSDRFVSCRQMPQGEVSRSGNA